MQELELNWGREAMRFLNKYYPDGPATGSLIKAKERELAFIEWLDEKTGFLAWPEETCEHGLSAWLCEGPTHYPTDF